MSDWAQNFATHNSSHDAPIRLKLSGAVKNIVFEVHKQNLFNISKFVIFMPFFDCESKFLAKFWPSESIILKTNHGNAKILVQHLNNNAF